MNYWDSIFNEGAVWGYEPAESAIWAANYFSNHDVGSIMIPGVGYGRNTKPFIDRNMRVSGIEISETAINTAVNLANKITIHHGSVLDMPFDNCVFDGIYCYSLLHLFNKHQRKKLLSLCYNQLITGGLMIFIVVSIDSEMYGGGKLLSKNRYRLKNGLNVYFYNKHAIESQFKDFGLIDYTSFNEPIKFMPNQEPLKCFQVICKKS
jgi:SAM-dependent methyltransferase